MSIESIQSALHSAHTIRDAVASAIAERQCTIKKLKRLYKNTEEALRILQVIAQKTQAELEYEISEIVSLALSSVFDEPYEFKVEFTIKRGRTEADIYFMKDGNKFDPMSDTGGGVVDIASFALRLALWNLARPRSHNVIILDEPFRFVDKTRQAKASELLATISKRLGIQFIIVTHIDELKEFADTIFYVEQKNGISTCTQTVRSMPPDQRD
jgi:DNA repair exonuclease SbcCD ATPase subunit